MKDNTFTEAKNVFPKLLKDLEIKKDDCDLDEYDRMIAAKEVEKYAFEK